MNEQIHGQQRLPECREVRDGIWTIKNVLSQPECADLIAETQAEGYQAAPVTTAWGFEMRPDIRNNTRVISDDQARSAWLWDRVRAWVPASTPGWRAIGLNERLRYYRYEAGQRFNWHRDGAFRRSIAEESRLTLMVYLNEDFEGGSTSFGDQEIVPATGSVLIFEHQLRHRGSTVTNGVKYVMRTDVMYRRIAPTSEP